MSIAHTTDNHRRTQYRIPELTKAFLQHGAMMLLTLWMMPAAHAQVTRDVEGADGMLYVYGALTESACRLDMGSARQDIALGDIGTGRLQTVGSRGQPVHFELRLEDCLHTSAGSRDMRTGALTWADNQPAVTVSFRAARDANNPELVKVQGVEGLGLRLATEQGEDVRLGSRGKPLLLVPGQNTLNYTVTPERTSTDLMAGTYRAVIDFYLSYD